jgi:hypothetical protein
MLAAIEQQWHLGGLEATCSHQTSGSLKDLFAK